MPLGRLPQKALTPLLWTVQGPAWAPLDSAMPEPAWLLKNGECLGARNAHGPFS